MPRNGSGVYSAPAGTLASPNTVIESAKYNAFVNDLVSDANAARPITAGGTGATSVAGAQSALSLDNKVVYVTKSGAYTAVATDNNAVIECTAALTLSLTAAATLAANWHAWVYANGGDVTIDPNAFEQINGATTLVVPNGWSAFIICTGSAFKAIVVRGAPPYAAKTGAYTAVASDNGGVLRFTTAATLSLTAAATLGSGWRTKVIAYGVDVTIDPNASEQINGAATFILKSGQTADIVCDGSAFWADVHADTLSGPQLQGHIYGMTLSNNSGDATNDIDIATGAAAVDSSPYDVMQLAAALTKRTDAAWAVGTNQGAWLDGASMPDGTGHVFAIRRPDTGVVDIGISASLSPTLPTNYTQKRRIGSIIRKSGALLAFVQLGDDFLMKDGSSDVAVTNLSTTSVLYTLTVPLGIQVVAHIKAYKLQASSGAIVITSPDETDRSPGTSDGDLATDSGVSQVFNRFDIRTNTSGQIRARATAVSTFRVFTTGWLDTRGRLS